MVDRTRRSHKFLLRETSLCFFPPSSQIASCFGCSFSRLPHFLTLPSPTSCSLLIVSIIVQMAARQKWLVRYRSRTWRHQASQVPLLWESQPGLFDTNTREVQQWTFLSGPVEPAGVKPFQTWTEGEAGNLWRHRPGSPVRTISG